MGEGRFFTNPHICKVKRLSNCWTVEKVPHKPHNIGKLLP